MHTHGHTSGCRLQCQGTLTMMHDFCDTTTPFWSDVSYLIWCHRSYIWGEIGEMQISTLWLDFKFKNTSFSGNLSIKLGGKKTKCTFWNSKVSKIWKLMQSKTFYNMEKNMEVRVCTMCFYLNVSHINQTQSVHWCEVNQSEKEKENGLKLMDCFFSGNSLKI